MKILVFTDAPSRDQQLLSYACDLAKVTRGTLHVLHILKHRAGHRGPTEQVISGDAIRSLELFERRSQRSHGIRCSFELGVGPVHEAVIKTSRKKKSDLIVIKNARGGAVALVSETISRIAHEGNVPVLAVPCTEVLSEVRKIVFMTNEYSDNLKDFEVLTRLAASMKAQLVGVHIVNRFEDEVGDVEQLTTILGTSARSVMERAVSKGIRFEEYQHTDLMEGISTFIEEESADALALSVKNSTLFDRLAERHLTRDSPYWVDVPIILFA